MHAKFCRQKNVTNLINVTKKCAKKLAHFFYVEFPCMTKLQIAWHKCKSVGFVANPSNLTDWARFASNSRPASQTRCKLRFKMNFCGAFVAKISVGAFNVCQRIATATHKLSVAVQPLTPPTSLSTLLSASTCTCSSKIMRSTMA